ncbi:MAG: terminase family protein [Lachnospiraceae bacterium]|nr:terminase family protein [Lachnospiraceae bacterium]
MSNVIWKPQPKQAEFMSRGEFEALYGGAAGGGKSDALVVEGLRQVNIPHYRGLLMRKTYPEARELIDKSLRYYSQLYPKAKYNGSEHVWTFPSGSKIEFGSMQYEKDRLKFQGRAFQFIGFDELTHFTWEEYSYLFSRCRPNGPGVECYIRGTANPGGIGHAWVKERFVTAGKPLETIWEDVTWYDPKGKKHVSKRSRVFVPATVFDNQELLNNDPEYVAALASMPEAERNALLYGDWDTFSGQVFTEWRNDSQHYDDKIGTHVINPFDIPKSWSIWCGLDWGYRRPFSVGWYAIDHDGIMYRIREYYGCTGTPNDGIRMEPSQVARRIREIEDDDPNLRGRMIHRVGDPAIWKSEGIESIGELMARERVVFDKGDHARISGKMQCHHRLTFDQDNIPMFYCFSTCTNFIRTVPALVYDEHDVEDINSDGEDHIYDEWRYVCMENPIAPPIITKKPPRPYNPLDTNEDILSRIDRYDIYR